MNDNNIDLFFKSNIKDEANAWDKDKAWKKLSRKRQDSFIKKASLMSISFLLVASFSFLLVDRNSMSSKNHLSEFEKRQILSEIESNLTKRFSDYYICNNCDERPTKE